MITRFLAVAIAVVVGIVAATVAGLFTRPAPTTQPIPGQPTQANRQGSEVATPEPTPAEPNPPPKVKLAVVIVFDQLRGDYLDRWGELFVPDGFRKLITEGAWFTDCRYPYANTATGPGHASLLTGCSPNRHGILNNNWYDRDGQSEAYCAGSGRYEDVPSTTALTKDKASIEKGRKPKLAGSPDWLLSPTVADVLKEATGGRGKVIGLSLKDRGAILPTGKQPDGAYWFDDRFGTSTYCRDTLPDWVAELNRTKVADRWFGTTWERFRSDIDYDRYAGPDDGPGEPQGPHPKPGPTFPHKLDGGLSEPGPAYYSALDRSPFGNDLLYEAAKAAILGEQLGADDVPDLLTVSFSSNDYVGHAWGPDSHEVLDVTLRSDALMADFLKFLDERVGKGNYVVVLTSDHGVCPNPEVSARAGKNAFRVPFGVMLTEAGQVLREKFGPVLTTPSSVDGKPPAKPVWLDSAVLPMLYLNHRMLKSAGIDPDAAAEVMADYLRSQKGIYRAYTRGEILSADGTDPILESVRKAYRQDRGGDLFVVIQPYCLFGDSKYPTGTSHGTPHEYDTHVPLLVYGPGVVGGRRAEPVAPQHAAPIVSHFLGVSPPADCEYPLPTTLFGEAR